MHHLNGLPTPRICPQRQLKRSPATTLLHLVLVVLATVAPAHSQTVSGRIVEFIRSADHAAVLPDGRPAVSEYRLELYAAGAAVPFHWAGLGKPTPAADGLIRHDFSGQVGGWPLPGGVYEARVAAVGPMGAGRSGVSNPFTIEGTGCSYTLSPATLSVAAAAGTASVTVTAAAGCNWTASSGASWIAVGPASGSGNGSVTVTIDANPGTTARTGTAMIAGQTVTVTQSGPCSYTVSPTTLTATAAGGTATVTVTTTAGCGWTTSSGASWLTASPASGSGSGPVTLTATANTGTSSRTGTVTVAGRTVTVTQDAACTYTASPTALTIPAAGGTASVSLTTQAACSWTASSGAAWVTASPASGSGPGSVTVSAMANPEPTGRSTTVTIGGRAVAVSQAAGVPCTFSISPTSGSTAAAGGTLSIAVTTGAGCGFTAASGVSWATLSAASGSGSSTLVLTVQPNTSPTSRTGTVTIAGLAYTVTQAGAPCTVTVSPTTLSVTASAGTSSVSVSAASGCGWSASSGASWITVSPASGSGAGTVALTMAANTGASARTGTVTVGGQTVSVTQAGAPCTITVSPTTLSVAATAGTSSVSVSAASGCGWSASSGASWITVSPASGSGAGTVALSMAANTGTSARTGAVTVGGQTVSVTQAAPSCTVTVSPTTLSVAATAGTSSVSVSAASGCGWSASSGASWITVSPASGGGAGTVAISFTVNTGTTARTGTITVGGRSVTITQAGAPCDTSLSPTSTTMSPAGGTASVSLRTGTGCGWTSSSPVYWVRPSPSSGTGASTVAVTVKPYTGKYTRTTSATIGGKSFTITQEGSCAPTLTTTRSSLAAEGGTAILEVIVPDGCRWSASSNRTWLTLMPESGTRAAAVTLIARPNTKGVTRKATVEVGGRSLRIEQDSLVSAAAAPEAGAFAYYLDEGATREAAGTTISLANPADEAVKVRLSFAPENDAPVHYTVAVPARTQVPLDPSDLPGVTPSGAGLAIAADGPLAVDRTVIAGAGEHGAEADAAAPARSKWVFEEVAGDDGRFLLRIANPNTVGAEVRVRLVLPGHRDVVQHYRVAPLGRSTIRVGDTGAIPASGTPSVIVESANGEPVVAERATRWRGTPGRERAAWSSPGLTAPAARWLVAGAETGGVDEASSWLHVTNTSARATVLDVTMIPELDGGVSSTRTVTVEGSGASRLDLGELFPETAGRRFGVLVEAHDPAARLVVERATQWTGPSRLGSVRVPGSRLTP